MHVNDFALVHYYASKAAHWLFKFITINLQKCNLTQCFHDICLQLFTSWEKAPYRNFGVKFQRMSPVVYAPRMKVGLIHAFGGTFPVTEKVIYTFIIMLSTTVVIFGKK